jgi:hypothetical protein
MKDNFTEQQREIVARKMGFDGPMQNFGEFLMSSPAAASQYGAVVTKLGEKAPGFAAGGDVAQIPVAPTAPVVTATTTNVTPDMQAAAVTAPTTAQQAAAPTPVTAQTTAAPTTVVAPTVTAASSQAAMAAANANVKAEQGVLSSQDLATAATQEPTTTALQNVEAAQGQATKVVAPAERTLQAGEVVSGTAVDQAKVAEALAQNQAAQGTVTEDMTTQGQLNKILTNFDAGNPPPWAASSMRAATAQLAARGLGASSLAGQAVIQAALEAATPIAAADAKVFEQMGLTNLSNRQQMAIVTAQQRATFLGQEFDQNFQSRVLNAAKVSDIANKNFDASTTIALENARITSNMDIANLSARNAVVLAKAAQMANLETTNLNNRQQVAVENAKSFLQMDLTNLNNRQQVTIFKAQEIAQSILTDTAAENAARAVNATNSLDASKVNAQLALTASQFNAAEANKAAIANMATAADVLKFNAQEANDRADFNANMATQVNMANAKLLADISTANTREINAANAVNAKNATDLSSVQYAQQSQTYRDQIEMGWKTGDNELARANTIAATTITANATVAAAEKKALAESISAVGQAAVKTWSGSTASLKEIAGFLGINTSSPSKDEQAVLDSIAQDRLASGGGLSDEDKLLTKGITVALSDVTGGLSTVADKLTGGAVTKTIGGIADALPDVGDIVSDVTDFFDGGCYITTAVIQQSGKPDNCRELMLMRKFRDEYMTLDPMRIAQVHDYYETAPLLVQQINKHPDAVNIYNTLRDKFITPTVDAVEQGNYELAHTLYNDMIDWANNSVQENYATH